jgi:predicted GIY-YIG superfamily endonuclease
MAQLLLIPDPKPLDERLGQAFFRDAPKRPGVYLMLDAQEKILYVGKAKNLRQRLRNYRTANPDRMPRRHLRMVRQVTRIEFQECPDDTTALAREAELLRALKPKFNRAGVWPAKARFLLWRRQGSTLALTVAETPSSDWRSFGPFGSGVIYFRAAIVRLLWYALNPVTGSGTMPEGWLHGRMGAIATVTSAKEHETVEKVLDDLFAGDAGSFAIWVNERTKSFVGSLDAKMLETDLESVIEFMQIKTRRIIPITASSQDASDKPKLLEDLLVFMNEP